LNGDANRGLINPFDELMISEPSIFKEQPPDSSVRRLHFPAVTTRQQYISWCKDRAHAILAAGDARGAVASMLDDIAQWKGDRLYDAGELEMRRAEAIFFTSSPEEIRDWIEHFS
jgi:hypothetical protein